MVLVNARNPIVGDRTLPQDRARVDKKSLPVWGGLRTRTGPKQWLRDY